MNINSTSLSSPGDRWLLGVFFLAAAPLLAHAQDPGAGRIEPAPMDLDAQLDTWRGAHGATWRGIPDPDTGFAQMLCGGRAARNFAPKTDADFVELARRSLSEARDITGVEVSTLVLVRAVFLPLDQAGCGDKMTVRFRQELGGLSVVGGYVNVLMDADGNLLSIQSTAVPRVASIATDPELSATAALERAAQEFTAQTGLSATLASVPELAVERFTGAGGREVRLAWQVDVRAEIEGAVPEGFTYWIDAAKGQVLAREASVHTFDITGTVSTMATPGTLSDIPSNPPTSQAAKYLRVTSPAGNATTDVNGNFTIAGVNTAQPVTFTYVGTFATVNDNGAAGYTTTQTIQPNTPTPVLMNSPAVGTVTSQANAFNGIATLRDYVRRINPSDATADILFTAKVNIASSCNAFFNGNSINFYAQSTSCANTAFSTVISHEQGHWMNVLYGTGNGGDGMGEGNADVWALYIWDNPINGDHFFLSGGFVRTGTNTRQFCGDCNTACYGEVHADGEVWMGAAWKVRARLNTSLGNTAGDLVADNLFMGWMNGYNQQQIKSIIELQWLTLDDNDANLGNGTPHITDIQGGFRDQGFPGYDVDLSGVTDLSDSSCEAGAYAISANAITYAAGAVISSAAIHYRVNGGAFLSAAMAHGAGNTWTGNLPYIASPAHVEYYVSATDSAAHTQSFPSCAPTSVIDFRIGAFTPFFSEGFEGATDNGWTHASLGDTSNLNDDWERNTPTGKSGTSSGVGWTDPAAAAGGTKCWGNDLGIGANNGAYQANIHSYLRSPVIDCSGRTRVQLRYKRWLTSEESLYDQARILINGTEVWRNPFSGHTVDTSWRTEIVDLVGLADNNASVTLQLELKADGGLQLGGWQVDDLELVTFDPAPPCATLTSFCAGDGSLPTACPCANFGASGRGCANSVNSSGALLAASGTTNPDTLVLTGSGMPNVTSVSSIFLQGDMLLATPVVFGDGVLCLGGTLIRLGSKALPGGTAQYPETGDPSVSVRGAVTPGSGAVRRYQTYYRNSAAAFCPTATFNITSGVVVVW